MSELNKKNIVNKENEKIPISGYISLILAILFFSGIFQKADGFMKFFDFINVLGSFGGLGEISEEAGVLAANFRGTGGVGARDGWLFALTLVPAVMLALGVVKVVEDNSGLKAAQKMLTRVLRAIMGIPGICGLALVASLQSVDTGASMTNEMFERGEINEKEQFIFGGFQFVSGATITNYFASGAALFAFMEVPIIVPMIIVIIFKLIAANILRFYAARFMKEE